MRSVSVLPLAFTAILLAACGSEAPSVPEREETGSRPVAPPERDLTLRSPAAPVVEVASAVELSRPEPPSPPVRAARPRARPKPAPEPAPAPAPVPDPAPVPEPPTAPVIVPVEAPEPEAQAGGGRELAPGKTVTIVPVSSGPAVEADAEDGWLPSERPRSIIGGSGGTCRRPSGGVRGIGIAGRIPVGIPTRRLR